MAIKSTVPKCHRPQVQQDVTHFRRRTLAVLAFILTAHIGCFVTMFVLIDQQKTHVQELNNIGELLVGITLMAVSF